MRKIALAGLIVVAASFIVVPSIDARPRGFHDRPAVRPAVHARVVVGVGPAIWWGPYPYWYYPPPYGVYAPPVVYAPPPAPVIVQEAPPVYIQQPAPPPPAPPASAEQFWYYCPSVRGYYPAVPNCPEAWVRVAPRPQ